MEPEQRSSGARTAEPADAVSDSRVVVNFGPQHPATHGTLRVVMELEGERVVRVAPEIGFLHTGMEKLGEDFSYNQWVPVSDRMNYLSALNNNVGYAVALEELFGCAVPERARVIRVILAELSRISDHLICNGLAAMDLGAFSVMLWAWAERERLYDLFEAVTGARLTNSYTRLGGVYRDVPLDFEDMVRAALERTPRVVDEMEYMLNRNRIFRDRVDGIGVITREQALAYGLSGPMARSSGVDRDLRRDRPYLGYERYEFDVPVFQEGDAFARYLCRLAEIRQSLRIIRQALAELQPGPVMTEDRRFAIPDKLSVWTDMESLIHHFKQVMWNSGPVAPRGEVYSATEAPNGELGFYLVSDGVSRNAWRLRVRPPSFFNYAIFPEIVPGHMLSDVVAILSSMNIIAGELDR